MNENDVPREDQSPLPTDGIPTEEGAPAFDPSRRPQGGLSWAGAGILGLLVASAVALIIPVIQDYNRVPGATRSDRLKMEDRLQQIEAAQKLAELNRDQR